MVIVHKWVGNKQEAQNISNANQGLDKHLEFIGL